MNVLQLLQKGTRFTAPRYNVLALIVRRNKFKKEIKDLIMIFRLEKL